MPKVGVEPTLSRGELRPERSASASSATSAWCVLYTMNPHCFSLYLIMTKRKKAIYILDTMKTLFPDAPATELENWKTPFQLLVAIILSAQTTDVGVNKVTKKLFEKYPTPEKMAQASQEEIRKLISSVNYSNNKAKYLIKTAKILLEKYNGKVPTTVKELQTLAGVGEKTAKVFLNVLHNANVGIGVDTHVARVSQRLGLTKNTDPSKIAADLEKIYPKERWHEVNRYFVLYGRYRCKANAKKPNPLCVFDFCKVCGKNN